MQVPNARDDLIISSFCVCFRHLQPECLCVAHLPLTGRSGVLVAIVTSDKKWHALQSCKIRRVR